MVSKKITHSLDLPIQFGIRKWTRSSYLIETFLLYSDTAQPSLSGYLLTAQRSDCKLSAICHRPQKAMMVIYKAKIT